VTRCSVTFDAQFDQYYCVHSIRTYFGSLGRSDRSQQVSSPCRNAATSVAERHNLHIYSSVQTSESDATANWCFTLCGRPGTVDGGRPQNYIYSGDDWGAILRDLSICERHWQKIMRHLDVLAHNSNLSHTHLELNGYSYVLNPVSSVV
jgi:hypothetical protein